MPLTMKNLTLEVKQPGAVAPIDGTWSPRFNNVDGLAIEPGVGILGGLQPTKSVYGVTELALPASADLDPPTTRYVLEFTSHLLRPGTKEPMLSFSTPPFLLDGDKTLDDLMEPTDIPFEPWMVTQVAADRAATQTFRDEAEGFRDEALAVAGRVLVVDNGDGTLDMTASGGGFTLVGNGDGTAELSLDGTTVTVGNPEAGQLLAANNLSDVASASASRANLGLGSAALADSTDFDAAGSAATKLSKAANLSDVVSASAARTNLGLGTAAELNDTAFVAATAVGAASGVAPLDSSSKVPLANLPATTFAAGTLGSDVVLTVVPSPAETTVLTTSSLSVGTWQINAKVCVNITTASTAANVVGRVSGGSATYTTQGPAADQKFSAANGTVGNQVVTLTLSCVVVVTVAGTVSITARSSVAANATAVTPQQSYAGASGWTATKQIA